MIVIMRMEHRYRAVLLTVCTLTTQHQGIDQDVPIMSVQWAI